MINLFSVLPLKCPSGCRSRRFPRRDLSSELSPLDAMHMLPSKDQVMKAAVLSTSVKVSAPGRANWETLMMMQGMWFAMNRQKLSAAWSTARCTRELRAMFGTPEVCTRHWICWTDWTGEERSTIRAHPARLCRRIQACSSSTTSSGGDGGQNSNKNNRSTYTKWFPHPQCPVWKQRRAHDMTTPI